jgi:hypothetical protein
MKAGKLHQPERFGELICWGAPAARFDIRRALGHGPCFPPMLREFLKSPHHAALAAATLGVGFATGEPLYLVLGAAAYVVGWVYLPDVSWFRAWVEKKQRDRLAAAEASEVADFKTRRDAALGSLTNSRRQRYAAL